MPELFNPYIYSSTGTPRLGHAPVQLRVEDGIATGQQLAAVQAVYARFSSNVSLSQVPNPTASGTLPDGSAFRITSVGNTTIVRLWPKDVADQSGSKGILVRGGGVLYLLSYAGGKWRFKRVQSSFGGDGVWASADGKWYFTDGGPISPNGPLVLSRQHGPLSSKVLVPKPATSVAAGMVYGDANSGAGFVGTNGKYVQVAVNQSDVVVAEAKLITVSGGQTSPEEVKLTPKVVATLPTELRNGLEPAEVIGRGFESRLRSGSRLSRAIVDTDRHTGVDEAPTPDQGGWVSKVAVSDELVVEIAPKGGYSISTNPVGQSSMTIVIPSDAEFEPTTPQWVVTSEASEILSGESVHYGPLKNQPWLGGGSRPVPYGVKWDTLTTWRWSYEYRFKRTAPVFLGHGWDDAQVVFTLESEDSQNIRVIRDVRSMRHSPLIWGISFYLYEFVEYTVEPFDEERPPGYWTIEFNWEMGDGTEGSQDRALKEWANFYAATPLSTIDQAISSSTTRVGSILSRKTLKTPWESIQLLNVDATVTVKSEAALYERGTTNLVVPRRDVVSSVTGEVACRKILHCDPLLNLVAYVEIVTNEFSVQDMSVTTVGSTAAVVLTRQGHVFHRHAVGSLEPLTVDGGSWIATQDSVVDDEVLTKDTKYLDSFLWAWSWQPPPDQEIGQVPIRIASHSFTMSRPLRQTTERATLTLPNYPIPIQDLGKLPEFSVRSAIDPGSGAGVVELLQDGQVIKAWALPPKEGAVPIERVLPISPSQMTGFIASA